MTPESFKDQQKKDCPRGSWGRLPVIECYMMRAGARPWLAAAPGHGKNHRKIIGTYCVNYVNFLGNLYGKLDLKIGLKAS